MDDFVMSSEEIFVLRKSIDRILPVCNAAVYIFFSKLFEIEPELRRILSAETTMDERRHFGILIYIVNRLSSQTIERALLEELGRESLRRGMTLKHIQSLGEAMLWTLSQTLRSAFTEDVKLVWQKFIEFVLSALLAPYDQNRNIKISPPVSETGSAAGMFVN